MLQVKSICVGNSLFIVKSWFFWAGVSFVIGGIVSLGLNLGVQGTLTILEDMTGYSIGWILVGIVLIVYSVSRNKKE